MILAAATSVLRLFPAETAHRATIAWRACSLLPAPPATIRALASSAFGLRFPNPVGLAAGFDKDAEVPDAMLQDSASVSSNAARSRRGRRPAIRGRACSA